LYSKGGTNANKGRLAAKKIDNVDLDALTLNEDGGSTFSKNTFEMADSPFTVNTSNTVKEVVSKGSSPYLNEGSADEKLKKFQGAKAISSDAFKTENKQLIF